jgi:hypothetical protein
VVTKRIVDMLTWHLVRVVERMPQRAIDEALNAGYPDMHALIAHRLDAPGMKWTLLNANGEPVACFGIENGTVPGVGLMWLLLTEAAYKHARCGVDVMATLQNDNAYRRIEAAVHSDCERCRAFVMWLGFEYEGTKRRYFMDGSNMDLFAMVKGA